MAKIGDAVIYYSRQYNVNPQLIAAIIWQESKCEPFAFRYENGFYNKYIKDVTYANLQGFLPPSDVVSQESERRARSISWGLMQIMGQTAREQGFNEPYLTALIEVQNNIKFGTKFLAKLIERAEGDAKQALLRWNGGGNKAYPFQVLEHIDTGDYQEVYVR